ncbi:hypothetical protein ACHAWF_006229 [Thalassiosira exigua]
MKTSTILSIAALLAPAAAFAPAASAGPRPPSSALSATSSRRGALGKFASSASAAAAVLLLAGESADAADSGESAEYNQLVELLKARSDENKEANANYAMRADKLSERDFKDAKIRRPKLIIVSTSKGDKIFTKEEFNTLDCDGKIETRYGTRRKQGGEAMKDYNDITYVLKD